MRGYGVRGGEGKREREQIKRGDGEKDILGKVLKSSICIEIETVNGRHNLCARRADALVERARENPLFGAAMLKVESLYVDTVINFLLL